MPPRERHPCKSPADTGGNPRYKMHNCFADAPEMTICGLEVDPDTLGLVQGVTSLCPVCWPVEGEPVPPETAEPPWTTEGEGREGDLILHVEGSKIVGNVDRVGVRLR
jgi:hypothetical protein